jgi:hypothetical protein
MLETLADIAREESRRGDFAGRDPRYIAIAGRDYGARFVEGEFRRTLAAFPFHTVCDLGCGSADRLIRLLRDHPEARGIGVELHPGTVALAREAVERSGLAARLRIVEADIARVEPDPGFAQVDLLLAFFNGHDLWPRERCRAALDRIHAAFPAARRFLLCDTWRSDLEAAAEPPTFTLGFELTHAAMGQYVPSAPEWRELFAETSWRLAGEHPIGIPFSTIFDLRSRAGDGRESPGNGG